MTDLLPGIMAVGVSVILIFILIWFSGKTKLHKEVLFLRPRDKRGEDLDITRETDYSVLCEKADPPHRFIKISPSYVFKSKGKNSVRFFGIEGNAYTAKLGEKDSFNMTTVDFLKSIWTDKVYNALPQKLRDIVEKDKIGITIEPIKIDPEEHGLEHLSSDEVNDEGDSVVLNRLAKLGITENLKQKMFSNLIWLFLGIGIAAILANMGLF